MDAIASTVCRRMSMSICMSVCVSICASVCVSVCMYVCISAYLSISVPSPSFPSDHSPNIFPNSTLIPSFYFSLPLSLPCIEIAIVTVAAVLRRGPFADAKVHLHRPRCHLFGRLY